MNELNPVTKYILSPHVALRSWQLAPYAYYIKGRRNAESLLPEEYAAIALLDGPERAVCDYISGMTDSYAMEKYSELFIPFAWTVK